MRKRAEAACEAWGRYVESGSDEDYGEFEAAMGELCSYLAKSGR